ncbi:hypothetical protein [Leisingera aquaemixtae]|uniref:Uncharacterized protein n=1 Tax=Leisingera aquaemixtae TaxID=1396826 RepID=A0A0P1HC61_9RHOB|nr:hypothetical protein [Leisingera aquaemixtae]CUI01124.1 hypothetical protein PHA8399_03265 [Leisingera aquaemixtae]
MSSSEGPYVANEYGERIRALEVRIENDEKSTIRRFGALGGIIALVLSIVMGFISFADRVYFQGVKDRESSRAELRAITARITEINWKLLSNSDLNSAASQAISKVANGEKVSLIVRANELSEELSYDLGFAELIVLSAESLNFGMNEVARKYARVAIKKSEIPAFRSESARYLARSLFAPGEGSDPEKARSVFRESIAIGSRSLDLAAQYAAQNAYVDWIISEVSHGNCDVAQDLLDEAISESGLQETTVVYFLKGSLVTSGKCSDLEGS